MPRPTVEPARRAALVAAAIGEVARSGASAATVARIARRAGVSGPLAHHYFGSRDAILLAAMGRILADFGAEARAALAAAATPRARLEAIVRVSFAPASFRPETVAAWLEFYVLARTHPPARRLLDVYQRRLRSNLVHALRPLCADAPAVAEGTAALIDGLYLRAALGAAGAPEATVLAWVDARLAAGG